MKALPKDLRYLLFDLDGTLTDSAEGILRCVQYALEQCGTPEPDAEKLRPFIGPPLLDSFQEFCGMPPARAAFAVEQYRKRFSTVGLLENAVYDGIPELLEKLREHGYVLAVATSSRRSIRSGFWSILTCLSTLRLWPAVTFIGRAKPRRT